MFSIFAVYSFEALSFFATNVFSTVENLQTTVSVIYHINLDKGFNLYFKKSTSFAT